MVVLVLSIDKEGGGGARTSRDKIRNDRNIIEKERGDVWRHCTLLRTVSKSKIKLKKKDKNES